MDVAAAGRHAPALPGRAPQDLPPDLPRGRITPLDVRDPVDGDASVFQTCYEHIARAVQPLVPVLAGAAR